MVDPRNKTSGLLLRMVAGLLAAAVLVEARLALTCPGKLRMEWKLGRDVHAFLQASAFESLPALALLTLPFYLGAWALWRRRALAISSAGLGAWSLVCLAPVNQALNLGVDSPLVVFSMLSWAVLVLALPMWLASTRAPSRAQSPRARLIPVAGSAAMASLLRLAHRAAKEGLRSEAFWLGSVAMLPALVAVAFSLGSPGPSKPRATSEQCDDLWSHVASPPGSAPAAAALRSEQAWTRYCRNQLSRDDAGALLHSVRRHRR